MKKWLYKRWKAVVAKPSAKQDDAKELKKTIETLKSSSTPTSSRTATSENVQLVEEWMGAWHQHDLDKVVSMSASRCEYHITLEDGEVMPVALHDFLDQMRLCYASFPDYDSSWESIEEGDDPSNPNSVIIKNFVSFGTHTGEPFAFGPFPAIPAEGKGIKDDPTSLVVVIKDGKVDHIRPHLDGGEMGPSLYYTQIGGVII